MDEDDFKRFLRRDGRSQTAITQIFTHLSEFENYLNSRDSKVDLDQLSLMDVEDFIAYAESTDGGSVNKHLWALSYWFKYIEDKNLLETVKRMRRDRIAKLPFKIANFRGVNPHTMKKLSELGIDNVNHMLQAGRTQEMRKSLAEKIGVLEDEIIEMVKLSDLSRIGAVKGIRARLYHDAGVDTPEKIAKWNPKNFREMLLKYIEKSGFQGIAPLPKEAENCIEQAKKLPSIVEY